MDTEETYDLLEWQATLVNDRVLPILWDSVTTINALNRRLNKQESNYNLIEWDYNKKKTCTFKTKNILTSSIILSLFVSMSIAMESDDGVNNANRNTITSALVRSSDTVNNQARSLDTFSTSSLPINLKLLYSYKTSRPRPNDSGYQSLYCYRHDHRSGNLT